MPNLNGNEKKYLDNCIDTTYVNKLEGIVAKATGSNYVVATSSGITGLHSALTAAGVKTMILLSFQHSHLLHLQMHIVELVRG